MGFADYLSRNPSGVAPTPNIEDNNFVINAIDEIKFNLIKNDLTPNGVNAHSSDTKQVYNNDVIYINQTCSDQNNAFCLNTHRLQSHSFHPNLLTASKFNSQKVQINSTNSIIPEIVAITTRNNPNKETYSIPILKRPRAPNKKLQMETETNQPKNLVNSSTQTEGHSNKGRGLDPIDPSKHQELFTAHSEIPTPAYRENLNKVFNEEFIAEASSKELKPIIDLVLTKNWEDLKKVNPIYYRIRRDLFVSPSNCLFYDNRLVIPNKLKFMVMDAIHRKHPGQAGMLSLAKLVWWPHIHSDITSKAQGCRHCIDKGKNLKALISKNNLGLLPSLVEPNQEIQMDFAGPIPYKENTQNNYILVTVDRLSRYPHAETFHNCDTETAIDYLKRFCKQHGIPRSIRCDQAQAFKAKEFEIFCKNKNIKLILAPAGDHRGTGMVERLIQTIKRRVAVLDIDPEWSNETLSSRLANIIENIRLIPNRTTKTTPFEAHFGRKPNTELSNILSKPSPKNLNYNKLKLRCLDKKLLRHNVLTPEEMWRRDGLSEEELDIQCSSCPSPVTATPLEIDSDDSENIPLSLTKPRKISPSELPFSIGDKTTKIIYNKKNVARKTIMRKTKEPRQTLAPQWNILPDGTISGYSPHTITIDTPRRKNTLIRKNDIAIATETKPLPPPEPKPRLIHMVACKTAGEY